MAIPFPPTGRSRASMLGTLAALAIGYATLTRITLMWLAWREAALDLPRAVGVLASGACYDVFFCALAALPFSVWMLLPARVWNLRGNRVAWHGATVIAIYALGFIAVAEITFWQEFQARFNFIAVDYLVYTTEVLRNISESYRVTWILLGNAGLTALVYACVAPRIQSALRATERHPVLATRIAVWWVAGAVAITAFNPGPNALFTNNYRRELASNGPWQFVRAFRRNELDYDRFYARLPTAEVDHRLHAELAETTARFEHDRPGGIRRHIDNPGRPRQLNVVMVMVESLSAEFMARYSPEYRWTPALDALVAKSLVFDRFYATGTRTDRGLEAVTLSIPPTPGRSIVKRAGRESDLWSLGNVLGTYGYDCVFAYGGRAYFDNMAAFFSGNGYRVVDQSSVPQDEVSFENAWGMADEDLYRQVLKVAGADHRRGKPFFVHVMTTSNHRPYTFPAGRVAVPSGSGRPGAVQYTDRALEMFLETARKQPWFDDTLFVVLGDHCASSAGKVDLPARRYHIPLLIFSPKHVKPGVVSTLASQIDVAPTLLALLHLDYDSAFFGRDMLAMRESDGRALIGNYEYLGLLTRGRVTVLGPRRQVFEHAATDATKQVPVAPGANEAIRAITYYQGASRVYREHFNAWPAAEGARSDAVLGLAR